MDLRRIVEESDTRAGRRFDFLTQLLVIISLVSFSIDTLPDLKASERKILYTIEVTTIAAFTIEYLFRLLVAKKKLRFIFSFYGLVDLAAILPFYVAAGLDLRALRALRLLRLFRALKLLRYNRAIARFRRALAMVQAELVLFLSTALLLLYLAAVGIYYFESSAQPDKFKSVFDGMWWAVVTLTTVGYGDIYPVTVGGRVFTFAILMIGLGVIAVPTGIIASALTQVRNQDQDDAQR